MFELCAADDLAELTTLGFEVAGQRLLAVKKDNLIYVYKNQCPHIGIPLEYLPDTFLDQEQQYIQCSNHGALFEIDTGLCISGPCHGQSLVAVPTTLSEGKVFIDLN